MDINRMLTSDNGLAASTTDPRRAQRIGNNDIASVKQESEESKSAVMTGVRTHRLENAGNGNTRIIRGSPAKKDQKHVVFQLVDDDPRIQARLPMRVMISRRDDTASIITTVKNFYGLYDHGVSFENKDGISIIATYDNFENDMTVYVRTVVKAPQVNGELTLDGSSPKKPVLGAPFEARSSFHGGVHSPSRHAARSTGLRSLSPASELGRRSASNASGSKSRKTKSKENGGVENVDGYSSDDGANASVASSRRSKTEQVNAEISVDNIVEGGRRKRAFESSELPLFVPPQMPISASISSISPQRRSNPTFAASPHPHNQQNFSYSHVVPSPQSNGVALTYGGGNMNGYSAFYAAPRPMRSRPSGTSSNRMSGGGIMPTPDPTVGSAISDEDVALQLMRLGDASNFSYGRTSTSTVDDALSGKAEATSSDEEDGAHRSSKKRDSGPARKKQRVMDDYSSEASSGEDDKSRKLDGHKHSKSKSGVFAKPKMKAVTNGMKVPMSPASMGAHSRKASVASSTAFTLGPDEEDLSSKPRCQRCRKSKKGCDRQRPCGRCKDAGIGIDGCVSEDEGNGRKGRYGRHMGVTVKKTEDGFLLPESTSSMSMSPVSNGGLFLAPAPIDKSKKRKR